ncbi:SRPBCC domain-containing protein [Yoonia sp. 2307UL14-13]|uniref:SRPBCC domain-containing protein n=1 Tax=Yoonia sp. 2307UL14-13 TaxID=3126506 RepID=UPI0030A8E82A
MPANEFSPEMTASVDFVETAGGTEVTLQQSRIDAALKDVVAAGWTASFRRWPGFSMADDESPEGGVSAYACRVACCAVV